MDKIYVIVAERADYKDFGSFTYGAYLDPEVGKEEMLKLLNEFYEDTTALEENPNFITDLLSDDGMSFEDDTDPDFIQRVYLREIPVKDSPEPKHRRVLFGEVACDALNEDFEGDINNPEEVNAFLDKCGDAYDLYENDMTDSEYRAFIEGVEVSNGWESCMEI